MKNLCRSNPADKPARRHIELRGVRVHNLQGIDLDIPLGKMVVLSGVSGSGKSSIAFDTLFLEGQRRYLESFSPSVRHSLERIERPAADRISNVPPTIAIRNEIKRQGRQSSTTVAAVAQIDDGLHRLFARIGRVVCPECRLEVRPQSVEEVIRALHKLPQGVRFQLCFAPVLIDAQTDLAEWQASGFARAIVGTNSQTLLESLGPFLKQDALIVVDRFVTGNATSERLADSIELAFREGQGRCLILCQCHGQTLTETRIVDGHVWQQISFTRHWECTRCKREFIPPDPRLFTSVVGVKCEFCRDDLSMDCAACLGSQLRTEALAVRVAGFNIAELFCCSAEDAQRKLTDLQIGLTAEERSLSQLIRDELIERLQIVCDLKLGHLILSRTVDTISGGGVRRLLLAAALGSRITGTLCVIDEPSAGLHSTEMPSLVDALRRLLDLRNSVIVVDHAPQILLAADHVIELGPGAGPRGGTVVFSGPPNELSRIDLSTTPPRLNDNRETHAATRVRRDPCDWLVLQGVKHRNWRGLTVKVPLGVLCAVSGPSGCGKTALIVETLVPAVCRAIGQSSGLKTPGDYASLTGWRSILEVTSIDQTPVPQSLRSNAATWVGVFDEIRELFAETGEAKRRGFGPQQFSFNSSQGGRCKACRGVGLLRQDMQFLPDIKLICHECQGTRYRREILEVKYRGRTISDVLAMSVAEAQLFFRNRPKLQIRLQRLLKIGLDYLVLGQPMNTLSGGETQRLKLVSRMTTNQGPTLIVCDEPTVGLHPHDVLKLIDYFDELLVAGHSLIVIDNNFELLRSADHVLEFTASPTNHTLSISDDGLSRSTPAW
ncbi:MAG: ATP-binding cassette domain-containing protein [Planctomycetales bacterium]|jgi:excinuclease ABC subunit A|nr:ATP-binding cassette domain-containing protein [Planctomycetales bacterium]